MVDLNKPKILIADDNSTNIASLTQILDSDYTIYIAKDGLFALQLAKKHIPDLILLDIIMPVMDGYEVLHHLKKDKDTQNIPIILISGLDNEYDKKKGLRLGAVDYIMKPFSSEHIKMKVYKYLQ